MPSKSKVQRRAMRKDTRANKLEWLKQLKLSKIELQQKMVEYRVRNSIEFFDTAPNPGPNPKQAQVFAAFVEPRFKTLGLSLGERAGKTTLLTLLAISVIRGEYPWNHESLLHLFPHKRPRKIRYIGQGWHDHIKAVVIPELEKWWPQRFPVERHGNGIITDTFWRDLETGGTIEIMSNTQDPKVHRGWSGDLVLYDEPCTRDIYTSNARGLVDRLGKEVFACTLLNEPWIDREIVKRVDKDGKPDKSVFWVTGSSYVNVGFGITKEGLEEYASKLKDNERKARIDGIPQYQQGLVYPTFDRKIHLFDQFEIPLDWMIDIAIDIHPREKQAVLFLATDPRGDRYICDEIWDHGDGIWVGGQIVKKVNRNSYRVNRIIIDPLAKGDSNNPNTTYDKIFNVLTQYGLPLEVASKDRDAGILSVKQHLMGPNKRPSLFILDNCIRTLYEIEGYNWDKETNKPVDKDDHCMENLYRLCLLNTKYVEWDETPFEMAANSQTRNTTTGY